jgi:hypothetical protein
LITVDLRTRILGADHGVWIARPGRESYLYDAFIEHSVIGPDLPEVRISESGALLAASKLDDMLKRAAAIRAWAQQGRPSNSRPPVALDRYSSAPKMRGGAQFAGILRGYFEAAKKGDLILIPPRSYNRDAVLAEFVEDPSNVLYETFPDYYGNFKFPVRRFRRLAALPKRSLPKHIIDILEKPNAFVMVPQSERDNLYGLAYGTYVAVGNYNTRFDVTSPAYNSTDDFALAAFINFVAANTKTVSIDGTQSVKSIYQAPFDDLGEYAPALKSNINSPGFLRIASPYITPLVVAAMLALAVHVGPAAAGAAANDQIVFKNSSGPTDDACSAAVFASTVTQLKLLGLDKWADACAIARRAADQSGIKAAPKITERRD